MPSDLTIYVEDEPGALARLGEVLGAGEVNIEGFCSVVRGGGGAEVHILVDDATEAFTALTAGGIEVVSEQEVVVVAVDDRPGVLGEVSRKLGAAGVNLSLAYLATSTRLVFGADNLAEVKSVLA